MTFRPPSRVAPSAPIPSTPRVVLVPVPRARSSRAARADARHRARAARPARPPARRRVVASSPRATRSADFADRAIARSRFVDDPRARFDARDRTSRFRGRSTRAPTARSRDRGSSTTLARGSTRAIEPRDFGVDRRARRPRDRADRASEHRARRRPSCCARSRDERCEATTRGDARRRRRRARARRGDDDARARGDARDVRRVGERSIAGREGRRRRATATRDGDARARVRTDGDAVWFRGVGWGVRARGATDVRGGRGGAGDGELGRDQDGGVVRRLAQGAHGAAKGCR